MKIYLSLLILLLLIFLMWRLIKVRNQPSEKREFGYLRWVIYVVNLVIFALSLTLIVGVFFTIISFFGGEWLGNLTSGGENGFYLSLDKIENSPFAIAVGIINTIASLGLLICMRAFMKNILLEDIFIFKNVCLARLSTVFLLLGSLVREGEGSGLVVHSEYTSVGEATISTFSYSFFNLNYLLAAVLVWTLSIILEKAIAIADENEFTI